MTRQRGPRVDVVVPELGLAEVKISVWFAEPGYKACNPHGRV